MKRAPARAAPCTTVPDHCVCTDDELGSRVPLVVGYIVVRLKPDPLLTFGQEAVVTRLPFSVLHHWTEERDTRAEVVRSTSKRRTSVEYSTYSVHDTLPESPGRPHGNSHTLMFPGPRKGGSL